MNSDVVVALALIALAAFFIFMAAPSGGETYTVQCPEFAQALDKALKEIPR